MWRHSTLSGWNSINYKKGFFGTKNRHYRRFSVFSLSRIYSGLRHAIATLQRSEGGEGGIRTHGTVAGTIVFETILFDHSSTSPNC